MRSPVLLLVSCAVVACSNPPPEPGPFVTRITGTTDGLVTVDARRTADAGFTLKNAEVRVKVDGRLRSTRGTTCTNTAEVPLSCDLGDGLRLALHSAPDDVGLVLTATLATNGAVHAIGGFEVLSTHGDDAGFVIPRSNGQLRYLHNGYQSWSFSGVLDVPGVLALPRRDDAIVYAAPNGTNAVDEVIGLSSHDAVIDGGDGTALVVGSLAVDKWHTAIALESDSPRFSLTAMNGFTGDTVEVRPNELLTSEPLLFYPAGSPQAAMNKYGDALERRRDPVRDRLQLQQYGWFSWNRFFDRIDEATVRANAKVVGNLWATAGQGEPLIEIDDGWEKAWGDWTPNEKFPDLKQLSRDLSNDRERLGLWVAPFVVDASLPVATEHPDWFVHGADGKPLMHQPFGTKQHLFVIDATHPDALAWAVENLRRLQTEGVVFFKLDFLYAAALDGRRHDPQATGVEALRKGLATILAAFPQTPVNLCGVPWLHAALAAQSSIRIGSDVAFVTGPYGFVFVATAARNLSARAYGPIAMRSDLDQFRLEGLSADETRTALDLQVLTPDTFALGDDLVHLGRDKLDAIVAALGTPPDSSPAFAPDLFASAGDRLLGSPAEEALSGASHVQSVLPTTLIAGQRKLVTNWTDAPADIKASWSPMDASQPAPENGSVRLPSHASTLLETHYAR